MLKGNNNSLLTKIRMSTGRTNTSNPEDGRHHQNSAGAFVPEQKHQQNSRGAFVSEQKQGYQSFRAFVVKSCFPDNKKTLVFL
jgi:hypothetical protein